MGEKYKLGTHGRRCDDFFDETSKWRESRDDWMERTVTWAHWPNRYWLNEYGQLKTNVFRRQRVAHRMFEVTLISAARQLDGLRNLKKWYIVPELNNQPETIMYMSHVVKDPDQEKQSGEMEKNIKFILDNGLWVPNDKDVAELDHILELGRLDGYEKYEGL